MSDQQEQENDPMNEELTLSEVSQEFKINRGTLGNWVNLGKLKPSSTNYSELGVKYYKVRRGDVVELLQNRSKTGRPRKST
jgi:predicted site-specific integrase-resolvase